MHKDLRCPGPEDYDIEKLYGVQVAKNAYGDELVVAKATVNDKPCYLMAWEIPRTGQKLFVGTDPSLVSVCIGKMLCPDCIGPNTDDGNEYIIKKDKHYLKVIDNSKYT